jgi:hypothetical protein
MLRHYYVTDDLDELEKVEKELEQQGFTEPQIHILSDDDAAIENHNLHEVAAVLKKDVVHSTEVGAIVGVIGVILLLATVYFMGWYQSEVGWIPFIFLAIIIQGFCTWEGGLIGIQRPNVNFIRFQELLKKGHHILFVDVDPEQELAIANVMQAHPKITPSGFGESTPHWVVRAQDKFKGFMKTMP